MLNLSPANRILNDKPGPLGLLQFFLEHSLGILLKVAYFIKVFLHCFRPVVYLSTGGNLFFLQLEDTRLVMSHYPCLLLCGKGISVSNS